MERNEEFKFIPGFEADKEIKYFIDNDGVILNKNRVMKNTIELGSDVLVIGNYKIENDTVVVESNCIDLLTGKVVTDVRKEEHLGVELLTSVDELASEMSRTMSENLTLVRKNYYLL